MQPTQAMQDGGRLGPLKPSLQGSRGQVKPYEHSTACALNYDCGGPEYPHLFSDWKEIDEGNTEELAGSVQERWRRIADEAPLLDGDYAAMLATRPESQLAGDWMAVPAARNLHWRYAVLHSAFLCCKQKVAPGEP